MVWLFLSCSSHLYKLTTELFRVLPNFLRRVEVWETEHVRVQFDSWKSSDSSVKTRHHESTSGKPVLDSCKNVLRFKFVELEVCCTGVPPHSSEEQCWKNFHTWNSCLGSLAFHCRVFTKAFLEAFVASLFRKKFPRPEFFFAQFPNCTGLAVVGFPFSSKHKRFSSSRV